MTLLQAKNWECVSDVKQIIMMYFEVYIICHKAMYRNKKHVIMFKAVGDTW